MTFAYSASTSVGFGQKDRGDSPLAGLDITYDTSYANPDVSLMLRGNRERNQAVIDRLTEAGITGGKIHQYGDRDDSTDITITYKHPPKQIVEALDKAGFVPASSKWHLPKFVDDTIHEAGQHAKLAEWRTRRAEGKKDIGPPPLTGMPRC